MNFLMILKREKNFLLILFVLSLLTRALFFGFFLSKNKNYWAGDSDSYHNLAVQIAQGNGFTDPDGNCYFSRVPGYAFFLATSYKFFSSDVKRFLWIQIILSSLLPLLIFYLSLIFFPSNILLAKMTAIFSVFHLGYILHAGLVMSESLFMLLFLCFMILFFSSFDLFFGKKKLLDGGNTNIFFAGIFLGIASLIRPVGQYLIVVSLLLFLFSNFKFAQKLKKILWFLTGWFMIVSVWLLRNYFFTGYLFFHTMPKDHFFVYVTVPIEAEVANRGYGEARKKLCNIFNEMVLKEERKKKRKLYEIELCKVTEQLALNYVVMNPLVSLKLFISNILRTFFSLYSSEILFMDGGKKRWPDYMQRGRFERYLFPKVSNKFLIPLIYYEIISFLIVLLGFVCFIGSAFCMCDLGKISAFLKSLPFISVLLFLTLAYGFARLRLPIEPFLTIFSLHFWIDLFSKYKKVL